MNARLKYVYHLFPTFNLGRGLVQLSALDLESQVYGKEGNPYKWDVLGRPLSLMLAEAVGYLVLTLLIDNGTMLKVWNFLTALASTASRQSSKSPSHSGIGMVSIAQLLWMW